MEMRFEPDEVSAAVLRMMMTKPATEVTFHAQGMEEGDTYVIAKRNGQLVVEKGAILTRWATTDWISVKDGLPESPGGEGEG